MKRIYTLLCFIVAGSQIQAQSQSAAQIYHNLQKLNTLGSVLYIAAHPDDENTRLLAYLANDKKYRTAYLSITRGDGGQNLIGKEQSEALGLIRTQELLAARRVDGAEQYFTRANDFGFSKNPEETFEFWNKDSILYDVVFRIRKFKPDIIICRFPTTGEGGHGHHTASAILAQEAYVAAADPTKFPDQLKFVDVWQTKRLFWNTFNFGTTNTTSPDQLKIDVGIYNEVLGESYGEIASESRSMHKSQGFGTPRQRGSQLEYFKILKGDTAKSDPMEKVDVSWNRIPGTQNLQSEIEVCIKNFEIANPSKSVKTLVSIFSNINSLNENDAYTKYWKHQKLKELSKLILACSGFFAEALAGSQVIVPGDILTYSLQIINRSDIPVQIRSLKFTNNSDSTLNLTLKKNVPVTIPKKETLAATTPFSEPYWLKGEHASGSYPIPDANLQGMPENEPATNIQLVLNIEGIDLVVSQKIEFKGNDPVKGEIYKPLQVLPAITINPSTKNLIFSDNKARTVNVAIKANKDSLRCDIRPEVPEGWSYTVSPANVILDKKGEEAVVAIDLAPTPKYVKNGKMSVNVLVDDKNYDHSIRRIEYDHIPSQFFLEDVNVNLTKIDLKKGGNKIGYINGAGDNVAECLTLAGYEVTLLNDEQIKLGQLAQFDAIVTGVRAFNTNEKLYQYKDQLMKYVEQGGNLIVQYNTNSRIGPLQSGIGPYPFTISRERVTNENAEVQFKNDKHIVLNKPNKISSEDFKGWIQERGIYFATEIDKKYETIFSMNDKGEKAQDGSLIIAKHGKGNYVYTGLVFFRELPAGIPGAYRLMANLLALPHN